MTLDQIKQLKKQFGYSNEQIAKESGVPLGTVQKIFSGLTENPRRHTIEQLSDFFETKIDPMKTIDEVLNGIKSVRIQGNENYCPRITYELAGDKAGKTQDMVVRESFAYGTEAKNSLYHTVEDYYALPRDERVELIDGEFYEMLAPSMIHQSIVEEVTWQISTFIRNNKGACKVIPSPIDVRINEDDKTMVEPDVIVVCKNRRAKLEKWGVLGAPDFVLEVLSDSTRDKDLHIKSKLYRNAGVREFWMIDARKEQILIWREGMDEVPIIQGISGTAKITVLEKEMDVDLDAVKNAIEQARSWNDEA